MALNKYLKTLSKRSLANGMLNLLRSIPAWQMIVHSIVITCLVFGIYYAEDMMSDHTLWSNTACLHAKMSLDLCQSTVQGVRFSMMITSSILLTVLFIFMRDPYPNNKITATSTEDKN